MKRFLLTATALCALAAPAMSATVNLGLDPTPWNLDSAAILTLSPTVPSGQQTTNLPCLICGANQPLQPAGFGFNDFGNTGNLSTVSFFSTATASQPPASLGVDQFAGATGYSLSAGSAFLLALAGNTAFNVGIDVNDSGVNGVQTLESFWFLNLTTHSVLAVYSPNPLDGTLLPNINNGTGFPDWTLSGFDINRGDIHVGDTVMFFSRITGATDGPDSFFLVPVAVPAPIMGAGFPGLLAGIVGLWPRRSVA
jgi:hypothetical protein